jgi:hypothetical protein
MQQAWARLLTRAGPGPADDMLADQADEFARLLIGWMLTHSQGRQAYWIEFIERSKL